MGEIKKYTLKIELIIFTVTLSISKLLMQDYWKLTKNHTKTLVFTTLGISQRKKLINVMIFTVRILYICVLIMQMDILKKKV